MSSQPSSSAQTWRRTGFVVLAVLGLGFLGGCSFKPLYGVTTDGAVVANELAYVEIPEHRDRLGQLIRNKLLSTMSPAGNPVDGRYLLEFTPRVSTNQLAIEPDGDISRRLFMLSVEYRLIDGQTKKVIHDGKTFSHVAYDRVRSEFANIQAETDVKERASIQAADDIRTRLAAFFASR